VHLRETLHRVGLPDRKLEDPLVHVIARAVRGNRHRCADAEIQCGGIDEALLQERAHRARDRRQDHVVDRAAELAVHANGLLQRHDHVGEAAVRADASVERGLERRTDRVAEHARQGACPHLDLVAQALGLAREGAQSRHRLPRQPELADDLVHDELELRWHGTRTVGRRFGLGGVDLRRQERLQQLLARGGVHQCVVGLEDHREAIPLQPLEDPALPEWTRAVESLGLDARRHLEQLIHASGPRQAGVAQVVVEVEVVVVLPDRMPLDRDPLELLPEARRQVQPGLDASADGLEVDTAVGTQQRPGIEDEGGGGVREPARALERQKGRALCTESFVGVACHGGTVVEWL
jgi:hypothetical protein